MLFHLRSISTMEGGSLWALRVCSLLKLRSTTVRLVMAAGVMGQGSDVSVQGVRGSWSRVKAMNVKSTSKI